jgi:hypothetical protein
MNAHNAAVASQYGLAIRRDRKHRPVVVSTGGIKYVYKKGIFHAAKIQVPDRFSDYDPLTEAEIAA